MVKYFLAILFLLFVSCIPYYKNDYGIYEPKRPNYSLKNKEGFILPENLDTLNLYILYGSFENDVLKKDAK